jgi:NSS family neurotransmitter:Na+ symporter
MLFATAFFLLLAFAALTSAVSLLEVPVSYLVDEHAVPRRRATLLLGAAVFAFGVPSSLSLGPWSGYTLLGRGIMDLLDDVAVKAMIPIGSIVLCLFVGWILGPRIASAVAGTGTDGARQLWFRAWLLMCRFVAPAAIAWVMLASLLGQPAG